eukprot:XP_003977245.1 PREDICTED: membrane progestin receptor alpha-B-like [Takifugu rubripes]
MASVVLERTGRLFISLQQIQEFPRMLTQAAPSMPGTVRDTEVPHYFRQSFVFTGYRPLHQHWRYYFLSIFQRHNETINIWTHLLALFIFLFKLLQLSAEVDFVRDPHSWPLLVLLVSSLTYTACSVAAHLLAGKSELCHYTFYFLDYVGVAQYQFGSAVVHFYYSVDEDLHRQVQGVFMPLAALLCVLSCLGSCCGNYCTHSQPSWVRNVAQVTPSALAYVWDSSPVFLRLWSWTSAREDPAMLYHIGQVVFFLSSGFFFTCPLPERCFPGRCDFLGQSHQLFHVLISCCTLSQIHATYLDFVGRRDLYGPLHGSYEAALFLGLYVFTLLACTLVMAFMLRRIQQTLDAKNKHN